MKRTLGLFGLLAALVLFPLSASAQTTLVGQVTGEVSDATGGRIPGVTVKLLSIERGVSRSTVTDNSGKFLFALVPLGTYDVTVSLAGFETKTITGNLVEAEKTTNLVVSLKVATVEVATTVVGETPVVDATNQTVQTRLRSDEFQKLPIGRNYQTLVGQAPGVIGTGNVNAHGALTSNNQFFFDGVNTTDPTTGTFGANLNFEAIAEVLVRTSAVSAEFGRGTGALVDVITKSGTNRLQGSYKFIGTNDDWNKQNSTKSEVANADGSFTSLARTKFDKVNPVNSLTGGGPIMTNRAWFFIAYEEAKNTTPQRQTSPAAGFTAENYQQTTSSPFLNLRLTTQLAPSHNVWFKVVRSPTTGFVIDYWGTAAERRSLTSQNQGGNHYSGQYTGVLSSKWTAELLVAHVGNFIDVVPFETENVLSGGAPYFDQNDSRYYNGATFDGYVKRPRNQVLAATSYFTTLGGNSHNIKFGIDFQSMNSENSFKYPTSTEFDVFGFNPVTRTFTPDLRYDFDDAPSKSSGSQFAFYARDKFQMGPRTNIEAGVRFERQKGHSDVDALTVDAGSIAPRISASYALTSDAKTLLIGSYGRFHDGILQGFSDGFAAVPQQTNYDLYVWNGSTYVFDSRFEQGASAFKPNTDVTPRHMDEGTIGFERQLSSVMGIGVRYVQRSWGNFVDDIRTFNADGTLNRVVANVDDANRRYKGIEFSLDKRFSRMWAATGSYTYSQVRGNHFVDDFSAIDDFESSTCRQTTDPGLGTAVSGGFNFPCSDVQLNLEGRPSFDRPHVFKFNGSYTRPVGPVTVTAGVVGTAQSKLTYTPTRSVNVLRPGSLTASSGQTLTYRYRSLGSERIDGVNSTMDLSLEANYKAVERTNVGVKFEMFNVFNNETKINVNNATFCNSDATAACQTAIKNFGTANARGSFLAPTTFRFSFVVRFQ